MSKAIFHIFLLATPLATSMDKPAKETPAKSITKTQLLEHIKNSNAHEVLHAINHLNAQRLIDAEVIQAAEKAKDNQLSLSRAGSIYSMIARYSPQSHTEKQKSTSISGKSLDLRHSHRSSRKHKDHRERTPTEQLKQMIKNKDFEGIKAFAATSGAYFINKEAVDYAQKKYDLLSESSNKDLSNALEFLILQFLKKYLPATTKERRKSYATRSSSKKEEKPALDNATKKALLKLITARDADQLKVFIKTHHITSVDNEIRGTAYEQFKYSETNRNADEPPTVYPAGRVWEIINKLSD